MWADIVLIVLGALASLVAGLVSEADRPGRLARVDLQPGSAVSEVLTTTGVVLPTLGATYLTDGRAAWFRLIWILIAFLGGILLYAMPHKLNRRRRLNREATEMIEEAPIRQPVRKWRT